MARKSTLFLLAIIHFMTVWSTKTTPLLNQTSKDYWALNMETKRSLRKFNNQKIHVIAIGGPTRAGKSFIMNYLLEKVDKLHFGAFVHRATANSVTKGMDIALVEHQGKFLLLIDCEGLGSLSSKMDPKLMLIMSMISQKLMYLTQSFDQTLLDDIGTMLANLSQISTTKENKLPLDTMHMILNKTQFVGENRDEYFFQTALNKKPDTKRLFNQTFTKQSVLFIGEKPDEDEDEEELEQFKQDITNLFTKLIKNVTPFHIGGVELTISEFLDFLEDNVLPNVNKNSKIFYPNVVGKMFKNYAQTVIDNAQNVSLYSFSSYQNQGTINSRCNEIQGLIRRFDAETRAYSKFIKDLREEYVEELENAMRRIRSENNRIGNLVHHTETNKRKGRYDSWYIERGFWWWSYDWKKSEQWYDVQRVTVYNDGTKHYGNWIESYCETDIWRC